MRVWNVMVVTLLVGAGVPVWLHHAQHGVVSPIHSAGEKGSVWLTSHQPGRL